LQWTLCVNQRGTNFFSLFFVSLKKSKERGTARGTAVLNEQAGPAGTRPLRCEATEVKERGTIFSKTNF
jgi:hypothetical protein